VVIPYLQRGIDGYAFISVGMMLPVVVFVPTLGVTPVGQVVLTVFHAVVPPRLRVPRRRRSTLKRFLRAGHFLMVLS